MRTVHFLFARVFLGENDATTFFADGSEYGAFPHDTPEYRALAARCGYGDDILAYCQEHEIGHSLVAEHVYGGASRVLWPLAHDRVGSMQDILHEEELVLSLQQFARAGILPGSSAPGFCWFTLRDRFREVCA